MDQEFFYRLLSCQGVSGRETNIQKTAAAYMEGFADEVRREVNGNVTGILNPDSWIFQHLVQHNFLAQVTDVDTDRVVNITAFRHFPGSIIFIGTAGKSHHHGIVIFLDAFQ